jgi:SAM-dependent methyltransferase
MDDWIDYYDSTHTIYASKLHRDLHFQIIARDIIGYISSPDSVVLDYACGEALSAAKVADACAKLYLAEPAPGVRGRLIARFAPDTKIRVRALDELRNMAERSIDLVVMNSVAQYMTPEELDSAFAVIRRLLKPSGRLVLGDILRPEVGMGRDVLALLKLPAIAHPRRPAALQRKRDDRETRPGRLCRLASPKQYRAQSLADDLRGAASFGAVAAFLTRVCSMRTDTYRRLSMNKFSLVTEVVRVNTQQAWLTVP